MAPPKVTPERAVRAPGRGPALTLAARQRTLARFYDLDLRDVAYDAETYLRLAHEAGDALLELGVGSGRLAIPLALAGHHVTGVDHDHAMLARARAAWEASRGSLEHARLRLQLKDLRAFRSRERFAMAFMAVNTFLLAEDDAARLATLGVMREHLRPGGIAVVDASTPDDDELASLDGRLQLEWLRDDQETGDQVAKLMSARYDPETASVWLCQIFEFDAGPRRARDEGEPHGYRAPRDGRRARPPGSGGGLLVGRCVGGPSAHSPRSRKSAGHPCRPIAIVRAWQPQNRSACCWSRTSPRSRSTCATSSSIRSRSACWTR